MLRARLGRTLLTTKPRGIARAGPPRRAFGVRIPGAPVPILRPTLWAVAATATIYVACAAYDVRRSLRDIRTEQYTSLEEAENAKLRGELLRFKPHSPPSTKAFGLQLPGQFGPVLQGYSDAEKMIIGSIALNTSFYGACRLAPGSITQYFYHIPISSPNYTLLTSAFGHDGLLHLGFNMFAMIQFGPEVARSTFGGNGGHFTAFFLSSGILSSLGNHLATLLPSRNYRFQRFAPSLGASGIVMALIGAFAFAHPNERMGVIFIPGSLPVQEMLTYLTLFETYGLFVGIPGLNFAHAAHLAGIAAGSAYVYFNGTRRIWRPTRRFAFRFMRLLSLI
ncbi:hypothetical protein GGS23DRAFT_240593 [Durotheca rogersii]|uniref:uncharacterized protein n=1 Tax=Durotheca rogersii TaxID=419775 RepID=UPI00221E4609|nr:uncharacterized protein GGS23DRAFT_240593 [Durotheca rogersii]KAI5860233.1 hypothetical protein GGS23DRAFT_240593 [Durotheca rogersii]